ncbi:MAG: 23S rRNA (pseudouridine(1915)-N(3))-methyltransferase RlmH [Clostridia bacterium]|nr:23S rRNA (pseudouridine(1915)-N(3))-methyltransferase RlmH [Clostridia bacterium]
MNINIISVGKIKEDYFVKAMAEYEKRISRFCKINSIYLNDRKIPDNPTDGECARVLQAEGEDILKKIMHGDFVIVLCVEGKQLSSTELAKKLGNIMQISSNIDFVIGGSLGLSEKVKARADLKLSLSEMTFPHRIARLVLEEQIYRAFKINANETYHK